MKSIFLQKKIIAAACLYFLISAGLLIIFGINVDGEANKVLENANCLLDGRELNNSVFSYFYVVYYLLVAFFVKLSASFVMVGVLQVILSFVAAAFLYRLLSNALQNEAIAYTFFIVYLLCYPVQKWNFFLYSESVHTSLVVIGVCCVTNWLGEQKKVQLFGLIPVVLLILFSRPVGLLFLVSLSIIFIVWLYKNNKMEAFYLLIVLNVICAVAILNSHFTAYINPDSIRRMEIICQVPEANNALSYQEYNRKGLVQTFAVIKNEVGFVNFFKNGFKKLGYFFGMYRNYYSRLHNGVLICFTILYPFALAGIFSKSNERLFYAKLFAILYLLITATGIFFTCDEWSNRFISPAFPFVIILACFGYASIFSNIRIRKHLED